MENGQKQNRKGKVRIVAVSDTHANYDCLKDYQFPPADLFIHAGDFTLCSKPDQLEAFRQFLKDLPYKHKIVVPGNHDFALEPTKEAYERIYSAFQLQQHHRVDNLTERQKMKECCILLNHQYVEIEGIKIFGSPYIESSFVQGFQIRPSEGPRLWEGIPKDVDILVTHMPPYGILDKIVTGHRNVGSKSLREAVAQVNPKVHIFGHIHEAHGNIKINETHFYNVSHLDCWNGPRNKPTLIQLEL